MSHLQFIYTILFPINGQFLTNSPLIISLPYGSWIYHYLCNQCLPPLKLWVRTPLRRDVFDTTLCDSFCTRSVIFSCFFTNKTLPRHITEILLKVALNTITSNLNTSPRVYKLCIAFFLSLYDITEILLKVVLNTMTLTFTHSWRHLRLIFRQQTLIIPDIYDTYR